MEACIWRGIMSDPNWGQKIAAMNAAKPSESHTAVRAREEALYPESMRSAADTHWSNLPHEKRNEYRRLMRRYESENPSADLIHGVSGFAFDISRGVTPVCYTEA